MTPSDDNFNAAVEKLAGYVGGTGLADSDLCDWSKGHTIYYIDWPRLIAYDALLIAGIGLIVWIILRKRKRDSN